MRDLRNRLASLMAILCLGRGNHTSGERRRGEIWRRLTAEAREEPEEKGKSGAEDEAGDDGKIESGVFAAVDDVPGELAETEREFGTEVKESADEGQDGAEQKEQTAEVAQGIHLIEV
jgi:hypothetical protein